MPLQYSLYTAAAIAKVTCSYCEGHVQPLHVWRSDSVQVWLIFEVEDMGPGVALHLRERIFEPFEQVPK